jgi:plasmid stabilization system protein ParE
MSQIRHTQSTTQSPFETDTHTADSARVVGHKGYWSIFLRCQEQEWPLIAGQNIRVFRHFESVVVQLKNRGITQFQVDIGQEQATDKEVVISPIRPKVLQRASTAEAYDSWFRAQVTQSLTAAEPPLSAQAVNLQMAEFKARWTEPTQQEIQQGAEHPNKPLWQPEAVANRQAVLTHLAEQSQETALNWDVELEAKLNQAAANPMNLPAGRVPGTLELLMLPHYVLVLQHPTGNQPLSVLRLLHTSKPWPENC